MDRPAGWRMLHTHLLPLKEEGQTNVKEAQLYKEEE